MYGIESATENADVCDFFSRDLDGERSRARARERRMRILRRRQVKQQYGAWHPQSEARSTRLGDVKSWVHFTTGGAIILSR